MICSIQRIARFTVALALAGTLLAGCQNPEEQVAEYLASARELQQAGDDAKAKLQLRNVLEIEPRNVDANLMMADYAQAEQDLETAASYLKRAVGGDEGNTPNRQRFTQLLILIGSLDEAAAQLEVLERTAATHPRTMMLHGMLAARRGERDRARELTSAAYVAAPEDSEVAGAHAAMLLVTGAPDQAIEVLGSAVAAHPADTALRMLHFQALAAADRREEAAATLRDLLAATPGELGAWRALAIYQARNDDIDAAESTLREMVAANPQSVDAKLMLAGFLGQHDREAAIESLRGFVTEVQNADGTRLKFALGAMYLRDESLEDASAVFLQIATADVPVADRLSAQNQLARIALKQENREEASRIVADILTASPKNPDALIARAIIALGERRAEDAVFDLRMALRERPDSDVAEVLLAHAHLQDSATELAERSYLNALRINPANERAAVGYAQLRVAQQDYTRALKTLEDFGTTGRSSAAVQRLRLQILLAQKDWRGATSLAGSIAEREARPGFGKYVTALTLQGQEHYEEALKLYEEVLVEDSGLLGAAGGIAYCYAALGRLEQGIGWLREFAAQQPDVAARRLLLANELLRNGRSGEAVAEFETVIATQPDTIEAYRTLGSVLLQDGKAAKAIEVFENGMTANPGALELQLLLAGALETSGDRTRAEMLYRELLERLPTLDVAANNLAVLLAAGGTDAARLEEASRIAARFKHSDNPWFADTLGWIYHLQGNHAEAEKLLARAAEQNADQAVFQYHLGAVLAALQRPDEAKRHLERAEALARENGQFEGYDEAMSLLAKLSQAGPG